MPQALPENLEIEFAGTASSRYVYGTDHAARDVEADDYFRPVANRFLDLAGRWRPDRILVVCDVGDGYEMADFVVAHASRDAVRIERLGRWRAVGKGSGTASDRESKNASANGRRKAARALSA